VVLPLLSVVEMARFNPDVLLIHTMLSDGMLHAVKQYREYLPGLRLVFGLDDLVGALPEHSQPRMAQNHARCASASARHAQAF
jgi:hypothetical protein